jgi:hypothetical protein
MAEKIDLLKQISPYKWLYLVDFDDFSFYSRDYECAEFNLYLFQIKNGGHFQDGGQNWPNESNCSL